MQVLLVELFHTRLKQNFAFFNSNTKLISLSIDLQIWTPHTLSISHLIQGFILTLMHKWVLNIRFKQF